MGEIMGPEYDAAWAAESAAHKGKTNAIEELMPLLKRLEERLEKLERKINHLSIKVDRLNNHG